MPVKLERGIIMMYFGREGFQARILYIWFELLMVKVNIVLGSFKYFHN